MTYACDAYFVRSTSHVAQSVWETTMGIHRRSIKRTKAARAATTVGALAATASIALTSPGIANAAAPDHGQVTSDLSHALDNFLNATYLPQLQNYDGILNLDVEYVSGDGQNEGAIVNKLQTSVDEAEGYAINMVKTDNAAAYTSVLE